MTLTVQISPVSKTSFTIFLKTAHEWVFPMATVDWHHEPVLLGDTVNLQSDHWLQTVTLYWPYAFQQQGSAAALLFCLLTSCLHRECDCVTICGSADICCLWSPCSSILANISSVSYCIVRQTAATDTLTAVYTLALITSIISQVQLPAVPVRMCVVVICILLFVHNTSHRSHRGDSFITLKLILNQFIIYKIYYRAN